MSFFYTFVELRRSVGAVKARKSALFEAYSQLCKFERKSPCVSVRYSISKSCAARTKGVIFVGLKIQKWSTAQACSLFFFFFLDVCFSAQTVLFWSRFRSCRDWKRVESRVCHSCEGSWWSIATADVASYVWVDIYFYFTCVRLRVSSFCQHETWGRMGKKKKK